jgi:general stress protein 26
MRTPQELERKFWKSIASDRTVMLGLIGVEKGHTRPMTAHVEDGSHSIWFFASKDNALVAALAQGHRALITFASKGHDLFASTEGELVIDQSRERIDRLWNRFVAAWYEGGKDDPKLVLLRFDPEQAEIWEDGSSLVAGAKMLLGIDPKKDYQDKVAKVSLQ